MYIIFTQIVRYLHILNIYFKVYAFDSKQEKNACDFNMINNRNSVIFKKIHI